MNDPQAAIDGSNSRVSIVLDRFLAAWPLHVGLICTVTGLLSVAMGTDEYWDLRYYHLYAPWAYLHGRYLYDIGPAQSQGFLNPTADFLFYGLISSGLNEWPRVIAFIMGAVHGINAVLILAIARHVLRPHRGERAALTAAAFVMGVSGAGFISLLGTTTNDLINGIFVLGALLGLLKFADPGERPAWRAGTWPGLLAGIGVGLKYTGAIFLPGLALLAAIAAFRRRSAGGLVMFAVAVLAGFLAVAGHHLLTLWDAFANPVFPWLNQVFRSPYYESDPIRDARFVPQDFWQLVAYPFYWMTTDTYVVSEPALREWRGAIAYVATAAALLKFATSRIGRAPRRDRGLAQTRNLGLVIAFAAVSFVCWELVFGIYRYGVPLEMLTGVIAMGAVIWIFNDRRVRIGVAIVLTAIAAATTVYPDWGRGEYDDRYVDVRVPPLPANSIVLIATWQPAAYFIPFAEPTAQYIGIENNYLQLSHDNRLASEVKRLMRAPGRRKFVLSVGEFDGDKLNALLAQFGRRLDASPCLPIWSNLATAEDEALSLCPVAGD